eukprot:TRINITY_DN64249_c0_g1_i1.p3 TRINITY_DN64249_c0_g1~~TRINITY_DN64249_c0_g1_i1.p3  ORF type:complete len:122 (+),score=13.19 TRINITY_DN64249_c0_g1_i1:100-465(+)
MIQCERWDSLVSTTKGDTQQTYKLFLCKLYILCHFVFMPCDAPLHRTPQPKPGPQVKSTDHNPLQSNQLGKYNLPVPGLQHSRLLYCTVHVNCKTVQNMQLHSAEIHASLVLLWNSSRFGT